MGGLRISVSSALFGICFLSLREVKQNVIPRYNNSVHFASRIVQELDNEKKVLNRFKGYKVVKAKLFGTGNNPVVRIHLYKVMLALPFGSKRNPRRPGPSRLYGKMAWDIEFDYWQSKAAVEEMGWVENSKIYNEERSLVQRILSGKDQKGGKREPDAELFLTRKLNEFKIVTTAPGFIDFVRRNYILTTSLVARNEVFAAAFIRKVLQIFSKDVGGIFRAPFMAGPVLLARWCDEVLDKNYFALLLSIMKKFIYYTEWTPPGNVFGYNDFEDALSQVFAKYCPDNLEKIMMIAENDPDIDSGDIFYMGMQRPLNIHYEYLESFEFWKYVIKHGYCNACVRVIAERSYTTSKGIVGSLLTSSMAILSVKNEDIFLEYLKACAEHERLKLSEKVSFFDSLIKKAPNLSKRGLSLVLLKGVLKSKQCKTIDDFTRMREESPLLKEIFTGEEYRRLVSFLISMEDY